MPSARLSWYTGGLPRQPLFIQVMGKPSGMCGEGMQQRNGHEMDWKSGVLGAVFTWYLSV